MIRALMALLLLAGAAIAQPAAAPMAGDPTEYGPVKITGAEYRFDRVTVRAIPYAVDIWARVYFPEGLPGGPYPLVLLMHGNHGICRRPGTQADVSVPNPPTCPEGFIETPNHEGYDYLATRLASHGYIVASINANAVNVRANGIPERGRLVQEHLRYWEEWNKPGGAFPFGAQFSGKVDLTRVGLFGHSRGGEGVRAAYNFNRQEVSNVRIAAVLELGPVDFGRTSATTPNPVFDVDNTAFAVLMGACDGDVLDNQGMRAYDRTRVIPERVNPASKAQLYLLGANHNFSNTEWTPEDPGFQCIDFPIITSRQDQLDQTMTHVIGFFRTHLGKEPFGNLFTGDARQPSLVKYPVHISYTESPSRIYLIEDFRRREAPEINSAGGVNRWDNVTFAACNAGRCNDPVPADWIHDPDVFAGRIVWPREPGRPSAIAMDVAAEGAAKDMSSYAMLAFRTAARFSMLNPYTTAGQSFSVMLVDEDGNESNRVTTADFQNIPFPSGYFFRRSVLKTVRIPLARFSGVDLTKITRVQFVFDREPQGAIYLTDVHVTP